MRKRQASQGGFTLVELSIVLVIIGLIVGGVLVGQDLVKAAQIRATVSQIEQYNAVLNTFRSKYDALPGDLTRALPFFNAAAPALPDPLLINGNGNGRLDANQALPTLFNFGIAAETFSGAASELSQFWYHLTKADMIPEDVSPLVGPAAVNTHFPMTKLKKGGVIAISELNVNYWVMGTSVAGVLTAPTVTATRFLTPVEAFGIDNKLDDGLVNTGRIFHIQNLGAGAAWTPIGVVAAGPATCWQLTPPAATTAVNYQTTNTLDSCTLVIRMQS